MNNPDNRLRGGIYAAPMPALPNPATTAVPAPTPQV